MKRFLAYGGGPDGASAPSRPDGFSAMKESKRFEGGFRHVWHCRIC